eukprot:TRINITY_DN3277_c0_g1_i3.p1 TRINITY_DN3277_c0_g1~~TRINITY_DN3277_c0_g1_i3.p1  ORF type:complete len:330 (-),score=111.27 TRINITY_DN3277_c0_g1_i3:180-1169(-)
MIPNITINWKENVNFHPVLEGKIFVVLPFEKQLKAFERFTWRQNFLISNLNTMETALGELTYLIHSKTKQVEKKSQKGLIGGGDGGGGGGAEIQGVMPGIPSNLLKKEEEKQTEPSDKGETNMTNQKMTEGATPEGTTVDAIESRSDHENKELSKDDEGETVGDTLKDKVVAVNNELDKSVADKDKDPHLSPPLVSSETEPRKKEELVATTRFTMSFGISVMPSLFIFGKRMMKMEDFYSMVRSEVQHTVQHEFSNCTVGRVVRLISDYFHLQIIEQDKMKASLYGSTRRRHQIVFLVKGVNSNVMVAIKSDDPTMALNLKNELELLKV